MKEYVQKPGVRPWHGNELVALQSETMDALVGFLEPFGSCILAGCDSVDPDPGPYTLAAGLCFIKHPTDGWKIARYAGGDASTVAGILYLQKVTTTKLYDDGNNHDAVYDYTVIYMDYADPGYAALDALLTLDEKTYVVPAQHVMKFDFKAAFRKNTVTDWVKVTNPNLSTTQIDSFNIWYRINRATGQVFLRGDITIVNDLSWLLAEWKPICDLGMNDVFKPQYLQYFTATTKYGLGNTVIYDDGNLDMLTTFGMSVDTDRKIYIGARRSSSTDPTYKIYFTGSYFFA